MSSMAAALTGQPCSISRILCVLLASTLTLQAKELYKTRTVDQCYGQPIPIACDPGYMVRVVNAYYRQSQECPGGFHSNFCTKEEPGNPACVGNQTCTFTTPWVYMQPECGYSNNFLISFQCIPQSAMADVCSRPKVYGDHGYITSPSYPAKYPTGRQCRTQIVAPPDRRIKIYVYDLYLTYYNYDIAKQCIDRLWLSEPSTGDRSAYLCSGRQRALVYTSTSNTLTVIFSSEKHEHKNAKGFWLFYEVFTDETTSISATASTSTATTSTTTTTTTTATTSTSKTSSASTTTTTAAANSTTITTAATTRFTTTTAAPVSIATTASPKERYGYEPSDILGDRHRSSISRHALVTNNMLKEAPADKTEDQDTPHTMVKLSTSADEERRYVYTGGKYLMNPAITGEPPAGDALTDSAINSRTSSEGTDRQRPVTVSSQQQRLSNIVHGHTHVMDEPAQKQIIPDKQKKRVRYVWPKYSQPKATRRPLNQKTAITSTPTTEAAAVVGPYVHFAIDERVFNHINSPMSNLMVDRITQPATQSPARGEALYRPKSTTGRTQSSASATTTTTRGIQLSEATTMLPHWVAMETILDRMSHDTPQSAAESVARPKTKPAVERLDDWRNSQIGITVGAIMCTLLITVSISVIYCIKRHRIPCNGKAVQRPRNHSHQKKEKTKEMRRKKKRYDEVILAYDNSDPPPSATIISSLQQFSPSHSPEGAPHTTPPCHLAVTHGDNTMRASYRDLGPIDEAPEDIYTEAKKGVLQWAVKGQTLGDTHLLCPKKRAQSMENLHCSSPRPMLARDSHCVGQKMAGISMSMSVDSLTSTDTVDSDMFSHSLYETLEDIYTDVALAHVRAHTQDSLYESLRHLQPMLESSETTIQLQPPPSTTEGNSDTITL